MPVFYSTYPTIEPLICSPVPRMGTYQNILYYSYLLSLKVLTWRCSHYCKNQECPSIGCRPIGCHRYCKNKEHHSISFIMELFQTASLLLTISVGTKAYLLAALAAFDVAQLPSTKSLGEECLRQIQDLQIAHWGTEHVGILQEDTIQTLIMGANRLLDFSLSME